MIRSVPISQPLIPCTELPAHELRRFFFSIDVQDVRYLFKASFYYESFPADISSLLNYDNPVVFVVPLLPVSHWGLRTTVVAIMIIFRLSCWKSTSILRRIFRTKLFGGGLENGRRLWLMIDGRFRAFVFQQNQG